MFLILVDSSGHLLWGESYGGRIYLICTFNNFGSDFEYAAGWKGSDDPRYESEGYKRRVRGD